jgi:hypothetical protein
VEPVSESETFEVGGVSRLESEAPAAAVEVLLGVEGELDELQAARSSADTDSATTKPAPLRRRVRPARSRGIESRFESWFKDVDRRDDIKRSSSRM